MRFLDCRGGAKVPSKSILDVGVESAINASGFDEKMFLKRGGKYTWSKGRHELDVVERSLSPDQRVFRDSILTLFTSWHKCIASTRLVNYRRLDEKK